MDNKSLTDIYILMCDNILIALILSKISSIDIHTFLIAVYCLLMALSYLKSLMLSNSKVDYLYADNICITWTFMYI